MSSTSRHIDLNRLPEDYVTAKFREYANGVTYYSRSHTYNGGCPICHEGKSWGRKKRCWWRPSAGYIHCFNCGETWSPIRFLMEVSGMSVKAICDEIRSGLYDYDDLDKMDSLVLSDDEPSTDELIIAQAEEKLPDNAIDLSNKEQVLFYKDNPVLRQAISYMRARRLHTAVNRPSTYYLCLGNDYSHKNRLVFPFFDSRGEVLFYQTRSLGELSQHPDVRYLSRFGAEKTLFNLDKVNPEQENVYVTEGPIDCCFIRNGVAVAGISGGEKVDLGRLQQEQVDALSITHRIVWVLDSQWLDETAKEKTQMLLKQGYCVFCWPPELGTLYKDINDYCVANEVDEFPLDVIDKNTKCCEESLMLYNYFDSRNEEDKATEILAKYFQ